MGCCFSSDDDKTSQSGDANERTRLLGNPVSNNQARSSSHDEYGGRHSNSTQKGDEQSAVSRILHQTATNVIDVSALDAHNMEQHEYMDRARQYSQKIASSSSKGYQNDRPVCLLSDVPAVERVLDAESLSIADLQMITTTAEKAAKALQKVKVEHKEDLVVQFGIP